jgi:GntR family transcriptional regulator
MDSGMSVIDSRLPRYQWLRDVIAADIAKHRWRLGDAIPTEAELSATHGVAVGTVRKAIDLLVADGLLERCQGRGTYVRRPSFGNSLLRFLRQRGADDGQEIPDSRILRREVLDAPPVVAERLGLVVGAPVIHFNRLRLAKGEPVLAEHIWLPQLWFEPMLTLDEAEIGPLLYPAYERWCGQIIASAEEILTVEPVATEDAESLRLAAGAPVVVIERLAFGFDGAALEWRRTQAPAATFRYKIDIR